MSEIYFEMKRGFLYVYRGTGREREQLLCLDPSDVADLRIALEG